MIKKIFISAFVIVIALCVLTACDPIYPVPVGELKLTQIENLSTGDTVDVEITYPNTGGSIVFGWKDQKIEIIDGDDIISVSELTITGLKPGTATIKVSAITVLSEEESESSKKEKEYSAEMTIKVE
ncbi:MAG: hypothetical protein GX896_07175 [Clostridiales bacterium]|nr:hypothetical protein [Clostridiales bacterium]